MLTCLLTRPRQATDAGCPPFRQFSLQTRVANISDTMEELKEAGKEYKEGLEVELQRQLRLEEMRVSYLLLMSYYLLVTSY